MSINIPHVFLFTTSYHLHVAFRYFLFLFLPKTEIISHIILLLFVHLWTCTCTTVSSFPHPTNSEHCSSNHKPFQKIQLTHFHFSIGNFPDSINFNHIPFLFGFPSKLQQKPIHDFSLTVLFFNWATSQCQIKSIHKKHARLLSSQPKHFCKHIWLLHASTTYSPLWIRIFHKM